ncbi:cytochrome P450 86A7-like [Aristolochia californica]|uniref:cytochrome P450 86A7-like n=1 Tax=Aristolochia californica TaxID=171875 RepID=UPI0035D7C99B
MMKTNFTNFDKGPNFAEIFDVLGVGIFNADGECWFMQRKMAISRFMSKRFQSFYVEKNHEVVREVLLLVLQNAVSRGLTLDLQEVFKWLSFDSTCASVLGTNPGLLFVTFMENGFSMALDTATRVTFLWHSVPCFLWKTMRLLGFGWERKYGQAWQDLDDHLARYISVKKQDLADGQARVEGRQCAVGHVQINQDSTGFGPGNIPEFRVQILNASPTGTAVSNVHVACDQFASARLVNPRIFQRLKPNDCLVKDGKPLEANELIAFSYTNSRPYPLAVSHVEC